MSSLLRMSDAASLALHAVTLLARHPQRHISSQEIAKVFGASEHTVAPVMTALVQAGIVDAMRGSKGGFMLAKAPESITMLEVYELIEGKLQETTCLLRKPACNGEDCVMRGLVNRLNEQVRNYFSTTTFGQLARTVAVGDSLVGVGEVPAKARRRKCG